jgi:hypothetical protein
MNRGNRLSAALARCVEQTALGRLNCPEAHPRDPALNDRFVSLQTGRS